MVKINKNLIINVDHKQAEDNLFRVAKKLYKKRIKTPKNQQKRTKRYHSSNHSRKASIFEDIGIDNALPVEQRKVYNLVGEIGTKETHFVEVTQ